MSNNLLIILSLLSPPPPIPTLLFLDTSTHNSMFFNDLIIKLVLSIKASDLVILLKI